MHSYRAVKSLNDAGQIGEYGILFGSPSTPDASAYKDYFTPQTDFWLEKWEQRPMLYHHGFDSDPEYAAQPVIGVWNKAQIDDTGVFMVGQLDESHPKYAATKARADAGELFISSDSADHLLRRRKNEDGTHEVLRWPLLAGSLTPTPAEPRMMAVSAVKSAFKAIGIDAESIEEAPKSTGAIKSQYLGEYAETSVSTDVIRSMCDRLMYGAVYDCLSDNNLSLTEKMQNLKNAFNEFRDISLRAVEAIMQGTDSQSPASAMKALLELKEAVTEAPQAGVRFTDHTKTARETVEGYVERATGYAAIKSNEAKPLPANRIEEITEVVAAMDTACGALKALLPTEESPAPDEPKVTAAEFRLRAMRRRQAMRATTLPSLMGGEIAV